ncbi:uncharacterized protein LOC129597661 [Paramacrobiotus metropolitanus]|uniref:uncharacterized protein LOC129597661 n=1 Tax=Paramacrobiotus metropolitanus TaxID=2943436 RepID=UPI0024456968|nr:uncharacterized protein LOC129597661 [Paramacrobiotus metropolitanus]
MLRSRTFYDANGVLRTELIPIAQPRVFDISRESVKIVGYSQIRIVCTGTLPRDVDLPLCGVIKLLQAHPLFLLCDNRMTVQDLMGYMKEHYRLADAQIVFTKNGEALASTETIRDWINSIKWPKEPGMYGEVCYSLNLDIRLPGPGPGAPQSLPELVRTLSSIAPINKLTVTLEFEDGEKMVISGTY